MNKMSWLKIVNPVLFIIFLAQSITGLGFVLHAFSGNALRIAANAHKIFGVLFPFFVLAHIILNWSWIKSVFFNLKK